MTDVPAYLDLSPTPEDLDFLVWILGGSNLLVALLKKRFEELLSLQLRLIYPRFSSRRVCAVIILILDKHGKRKIG